MLRRHGHLPTPASGLEHIFAQADATSYARQALADARPRKETSGGRHLFDDPPQHAEPEERRRLLGAALTATGFADRAAFRRVYALTSAKLFGICLRICGERQAAEDVLQEVYIIVWRRAPSFDETRASPITWLAAIARNRALDWRRANRRSAPQPAPDYAVDPDAEPRDPARAADRVMIDTQEAARLRACLDELEERPRIAIRAAFLDGLSYPELARREGVPLPTMKSMVRRALIRLRGCLDDDA